MKKKTKQPKPTIFTRCITLVATWSPIIIARWLLSFLNYKEARVAFHNTHPFTRLWHLIYERWVGAANTEGEIKGIFFETNFGFGEGKTNPLKDKAVEKWLSFLTNPFSEDHQSKVWRMRSVQWGMSRHFDSYPLIVARQIEFVKALMSTNDKRDAYNADALARETPLQGAANQHLQKVLREEEEVLFAEQMRRLGRN
ncbi:MAG: hypothetical protein WC761_02365 [Candidatus Paceibacterota bacterium]|jgi:hypothetical protein